MSLIKTLKRTIGVVSLVGILGGTAELILYSVLGRKDETQRTAEIEKKKKIIQSQLEDRINKSVINKCQSIEEAIEKGLMPGKILTFTDGNGRKMVTFYTGKDANGNYEFERAGEGNLTIDQIEKKGYKLDNFHAPQSQ